MRQPLLLSTLCGLQALTLAGALLIPAPGLASDPPAATTAAQANTRRFVTGSFVRMRERPEKGSPVVDLLPWGTQVELTSTEERDGYYPVRLHGSTRTGAVAADYLSMTPPTPGEPRRGCPYADPMCWPTVNTWSIDELERTRPGPADWDQAVWTWRVALGPRSPYASQSSVEALNASPLFRPFGVAKPTPRRPIVSPDLLDPKNVFADPPGDARYVPPSDLIVGRVLAVGERWKLELAHAPRGDVHLSADRRTVLWNDPRKAILVDTCAPGFVELEVTLSAEIASGEIWATPRGVPEESLACLQGKDVTYGRDLGTVALLVMDQGGLVRLRDTLTGTTASRTPLRFRTGVFEIRFQEEGTTHAVFRGVEGPSCGAVDTSIQYRVGEGWERVAAMLFGDSC